ncbi:MAG: oligosaccharide flippase family protein [Armatimonadota bacterium]|nr:oligosaccharide flippase family protein [Armatimonadota bacterium]
MNVESLRRKAVRAGVHLTLRRIGGLLLAFIGLLYLTRIIGPEAYGAFAAAAGVVGYFYTVGAQGGRFYLIRQPEGIGRHLFDLVFWWLLGVGAAAGALQLSVGMGLQAAGYAQELFATALVAIAGTLPLGLIRGVPAALLERNLDYGKLAVIEISGQAIFYLVGIPLAWHGAGVWALILAHWSSELLQTVWLFWAARYAPRWYWNRTAFWESIQESLKMAAGAWVYELRRFGVPLVLLPLAGERAVGYYALAERLVSSLSFITTAIAQLSVPLYAKLQARPTELLRAIHLSAQAQLLGFSGFALMVVLVGQAILPRIFGSEWDIQTIILTTAAFSVHMMLFVVFGAQAQAMYVIRKTGFMLWLNVLLIACLFPFTWLFTWLTPASYKAVGFVVGTMLAHQPNHLLLHLAMNRWIGKPIYGMNLIWAAGFGAAMFAPFTNYWSLIGLLVFLHPASIRAMREVYQLLREARGAKHLNGTTVSSDVA